MVDSGIKVADECRDKIQALEKGNLGGMICVIKPPEGQKKDAVVVVEEWAKSENVSWEDFGKRCMAHPMCFGLSFLHWTTKEGRSVDKLVFVFWNGDNAKIGDRMKYSSTKDQLKKSIKSINNIIQASDEDEFDYKNIVETVSKGDFKLV